MELNYKTSGSGPALIILHGLFGSLDNWQSLAKQYAADFSVYSLDLRNHGKSPHSDAPFTYAQMAEDVMEFLHQHGILRASIMGHSMGGKVAMQIALHQGELLEKLIVSDMAPVNYRPHHTEVFRAMDKLKLDALKNRNEADEILATELPDFAVRQFLLKNLELNPQGGYRWKFNLAVIRRDYAGILEAVEGHPFEGETLFIRGGKSPYVKDEYLPRIQQLFPSARLMTVENAGHWIHAEAPEAYYEKTKKFLLGQS